MRRHLSGVAVVGSANLDLVVEVSRLPVVGETVLGEGVGRFPGGKGLNQAVAAARMGADTRLCAMVGDDEAGRQLQRAAAEAGVRGSLRCGARPTGIAHVLSVDGDNSIVVAAGANAELAPEHAVADVSDAAVVLAQLEVPIDTVAAALATAKAAGAVTLLNAAPAVEAALGLLGFVDVLIVNESECDELGGLDRLIAAPIVVRTEGARGVTVHRGAAEPLVVPAFAVDAIDTTGAGDAFCGALAAALEAGHPIERAVARASAAGAIAVQHLGATTPALTPAAVTALLTL